MKIGFYLPTNVGATAVNWDATAVNWGARAVNWGATAVNWGATAVNWGATARQLGCHGPSTGVPRPVNRGATARRALCADRAYQNNGGCAYSNSYKHGLHAINPE